jgi:hypothetical protein
MRLTQAHIQITKVVIAIVGALNKQIARSEIKSIRAFRLEGRNRL